MRTVNLVHTNIVPEPPLQPSSPGRRSSGLGVRRGADVGRLLEHLGLPPPALHARAQLRGAVVLGGGRRRRRSRANYGGDLGGLERGRRDCAEALSSRQGRAAAAAGCEQAQR